jgi:hypothetical protein
MGPQILVSPGAPHVLDEHVVAPGVTAGHADLDRLALKDGRKRHAGKLAALVGVEDLRRPEAYQRLDVEIDLQLDRQTPY